MLRLPILALLAVLALVTAGCGGNGEPEGVEPETWAADVCGALATWQASLQQRAQALSQEVLQAPDPETAGGRIVTFLDEVIGETDTLIEEFDEAGAPAVEQGDELRRDFREGLGQMRTAFEDARAQVEGAPTDDSQAFQRQLTEIGSELQEQGRAIGQTMEGLEERYDAPEVAEAFDENEECRQIRR